MISHLLNRKSLLNIAVFTISVIGCKKPANLDPSYIEVEPEPYFPCYPGSYWTYADSLGNEIVSKVDEGYQQYQIKAPDDSLSDIYLLPRIDSHYYFKNFKIYDTPGTLDIEHNRKHKSDSFEKIVVLNNYDGERIFVDYYSGHYNPGMIYQNNNFVSQIDSFYIGDKLFNNVIINQVSKVYVGYNAQVLNVEKPFPIFMRYFAKDIGLILEKVIYNPNTLPDTVTIRSIISYHINKN